jgi:hypothetical protein
MGIILTPEHSHIVDACRKLCLRAVTFAKDKQAYKAYNFMASAYKQRNEFPVGTPAYDLCQSVIDQAEGKMQEVYEYFPKSAL